MSTSAVRILLSTLTPGSCAMIVIFRVRGLGKELIMHTMPFADLIDKLVCPNLIARNRCRQINMIKPTISFRALNAFSKSVSQFPQCDRYKFLDTCKKMQNIQGQLNLDLLYRNSPRFAGFMAS